MPVPPPGDLSDPGMESTSHASPVLAGGFFTTGPQQQSQIAMAVSLEEFHKMILLLAKTSECADNNMFTGKFDQPPFSFLECFHDEL